MAMNIELSSETQRLIDEKLRAGWFEDASSLVEAAVQSYFVGARNVPYTREELEGKLARSIDQLNRGEGIGAQEVFQRLRSKEERLRQDRE